MNSGQAGVVIDGLQYSAWNREIFEQMRAGGLHAVHATAAFWEDSRELLRNLGRWNRLFREHADLVMPVVEAGDILRARDHGRVGIILGLQNCSPLEGDVDMVAILKRLNVHIMQLSYNNQSLICAGCYEASDPGISRFGTQVIREMNRAGMVIDMSHSGEFSTLEAIRLSERPIVISHANPASFHDAKRNKSDTVLRALAESEGLLGFSCYPFHLRNGSRCTLEAFTAMIARTVDLMGLERVAIGSDLCQGQPREVLAWMRNGRWSLDTDYGEGARGDEAWPQALDWLRSTADFQNIARGLSARGFIAGEVSRIMGDNWFAFLSKSLAPAPAASGR